VFVLQTKCFAAERAENSPRSWRMRRQAMLRKTDAKKTRAQLCAVALLAVASGVLGFGAIPSSFALQAQALFVVFAAIVFIQVAHALFSPRWRAPGGGERALLLSGRAAGALIVVAAPLAFASFWSAHDLSAEKIGREIDLSAVQLIRQTRDAVTALNPGEPPPTRPDASQGV
jgi:hypothetical protein